MGNPFAQAMSGAPINYAPASSSAGINNTQPSVTGQFVIDGTPVRVAAMGLAAGLVLLGFRKAGFKFNVGVS